jgi:diacylglycerol kinase
MGSDVHDQENEPRPSRAMARWLRRFADAFHGIAVGVRSQESLHVHLVVTFIAMVIAAFLRFEAWRWCLLLVCISMVIALELMNSAIERLVKTLHPAHDQGLAETLHLAASSVLVGAMGSVVIGLIVFVEPIWRLASLYFD